MKESIITLREKINALLEAENGVIRFNIACGYTSLNVNHFTIMRESYENELKEVMNKEKEKEKQGVPELNEFFDILAANKGKL